MKFSKHIIKPLQLSNDSARALYSTFDELLETIACFLDFQKIIVQSTLK